MTNAVEGPQEAKSSSGYAGNSPGDLVVKMPVEVFNNTVGHGVLRFDERDLFSTYPPLQLLFAIDRSKHIIETFVVDQPIARILGRESFDFPVLVLKGATINAVCHSDIERTRVAADDVNEIFVLFHQMFLTTSSLTL